MRNLTWTWTLSSELIQQDLCDISVMLLRVPGFKLPLAVAHDKEKIRFNFLSIITAVDSPVQLDGR